MTETSVRGASDISELWSARSVAHAPDHKTMDVLVRVYFGILPEEFKDFFHPEMHVHNINMIRLAWDDIANLAGKIFQVMVRPDNDTQTAKERAERQEQIAYGYNDAARHRDGPSMALLMKVLMWWMAGTANSVAMVLPDYELQSPFFTFRDPRSYFPPVDHSPWTQAAPKDGLFAYRMSLGEIKARYPDKAQEIDQRFTRTIMSAKSKRVTKARDDYTEVFVGEYYTADTWQLVTLEDQVVQIARSDTGDPGHPGVNPVVAMSLYAPGRKGRSLFADQISIQAAMARMFSQKLDFYDRTLYPIIFTTPLSGEEVRVGPWAVNEFDISSFPGVNPRVDVVAPANQVDADQTMAFALGLQRMLNRNPESFQGQAPGGRADSAKALAELRQGVISTIQEGIWPPVIDALPRLYRTAAMMDVNLWGNVRKQATGTRKNSHFRTLYIPNRDLRGRETHFEIEPGVGVAGIQGTLELLQLYGAKLLPLDEVLEQLEHVSNPVQTKKRIQGDALDELIFADLSARAQNQALPPGAIAELKEMVSRGKDLTEAIKDMEQRGRLAPPAPPPGAAPGPEAGGIPPELAGLLPQLGAFGRRG